MYSTLLLAIVLVLGSWNEGVSASDITPIVGWDNQLFPSYILATSAMSEDESQDPTVLEIVTVNSDWWLKHHRRAKTSK